MRRCTPTMIIPKRTNTFSRELSHWSMHGQRRFNSDMRYGCVGSAGPPCAAGGGHPRPCNTKGDIACQQGRVVKEWIAPDCGTGRHATLAGGEQVLQPLCHGLCVSPGATVDDPYIQRVERVSVDATL